MADLLELIERYTSEQGCEWLFNPPHASHFGGVWERQIGTIRRVLDAMLLEVGSSQLTHELLVTLMAEVTGIVNARPISAISSEVGQPHPLTPAMLLTMKTRPIAPPPGTFTPQDLFGRRTPIVMTGRWGGSSKPSRVTMGKSGRLK